MEFVDLGSKGSSATCELGGLRQTPQSLVPQFPPLQNGVIMVSLEGSCKTGDGINNKNRDFPGGAVVKNPPANAGDTGSIPGPGRSHVPRSN